MIIKRCTLLYTVLILVLFTIPLSSCVNITPRDDTSQDEQETTSMQQKEKPLINQFSAIPSNITEGQSTTISWAVTGAESVSIEPEVGSVALSGGSTSVSPSSTTVYIITATNLVGTSTASTEVSVASAPANEPEPQPPLESGTPPFIEYFTANPESVLLGGSSTLSWNVTNTSSVEISPGIGAVGSTGTQSVSPTTTTTYTLTATNSYDSRIQSVTISVSTVPLIIPSVPMVVLKPDLEPTFISRQSVTEYTAHIKNNGAVASGPFKIELKSTCAIGPTALPVFIGGPSIEPGETADIPFTYSQHPCCGMGASSFKITLFADNVDNISETEEGNNKFTRTFNCY